MLPTNRNILFLLFAFLATLNLTAALPRQRLRTEPERRLVQPIPISKVTGPIDDSLCKLLNTCKSASSSASSTSSSSATNVKTSSTSTSSVGASSTSSSSASSTAKASSTSSIKPSSSSGSGKYKAKILAPGNTARPLPTYVFTMPVLSMPLLGSSSATKTTSTFTSTKTSLVTVTTTKTTTSTSTSTAVATKTLSGQLTTVTAVTVVPVATVVPVTTVLTTTALVPVTTTITPLPVATPTATNVATPVLLTTTTVVATPTAVPTADPTNPDEQAVLDAHNNYRVKHGAPSLTWNATLAQYALNWASKCIWAHSGGPYGENGAASVGMPMTMATAADMWYGEMAQYNFSAPGFSEATGHFSQLVWSSSHTVGCAMVQCTPASLGFAWTGPEMASNVWCEYSNTPGNVIGFFDKNVVPPIGATLVNGLVSTTNSLLGSTTPILTGRSDGGIEGEE
ncbi:F-box protein: endocytic membrane traffic, recycling ReCYcling 1 [Tilletia horrida]|uniref:F-box protein: endocytic membrane traffic, recycling ReCYcling 1 n=1 Tax=Tilletia horrida TaxID=155126 RepID=A0AAN6JS43_9BASI|nr:F-box protein: endocytic membrane traffic, recycling ReCYcling 1 [Tilletia horrida]KAK0534843.1 F-box protein: endocytic membrane traffic, recycling ReCYcling 1 [Tilletia horrida]KAK0538883.1 F-box protein: endocytic membrane traffic, recycling ReCYcling 1 [Tilletia horrida]KAK0566754.1 F-box protein: endocytic membrane traffic, recycling ReCYcling 1 [Tilletia horrida]